MRDHGFFRDQKGEYISKRKTGSGGLLHCFQSNHHETLKGGGPMEILKAIWEVAANPDMGFIYVPIALGIIIGKIERSRR